MSRRNVTPLLLAASVFLSGATGILTGAFTPAHAITSVEELRDVDSSSWAYQALADLVEKYDVIEGYPDYTFKGQHNATRNELAAALNALIKAVGRDLARLGAEKANKSDLATLAKLQDEFRNELAALNARTSALESRASAIEAKNSEQDNRLDLLEKTQFHGDFSVGILSDTAGNGNQVVATNDSIFDGISTLGRFRLGVKVPVVPGYDNSSVGEGDVIARLVGAFGRWTPQGANAGVQNVNPLSGYSAIAGGASAFNEGIQTDSLGLNAGTTGINLRQNLYVESAYYKQHYKPGIPILTDLFPGVNVFPDNDNYRTTADVYVGILPWRNLFNRSPYRGDELNQFQNTALVNNAGLLVNNISPTLAIAWHQGLGEHLSADLTGAVSTMDQSDWMDGLSASYELAFNYDTAFLGTSYTKPGSLYFGGYNIFFNGNRSLFGVAANTLGFVPLDRDGAAANFLSGTNNNINAFYTGWNQEWWRGIGTSVDWVINETGGTNALVNSLRNGTGANATFGATGRIVGVQNALSAVLTMPLTVFNKDLTNRAKDVWGFGYSWIDPTELPGEGATFTAGDEHVFETFYRWAVNNSVTVIPSMQVIVNRAGVKQNDADVVFGVRTNYVF
jgi:hypothetical protein